MNTYINVDAIQDGSIPVEKIKNLDIGTVVDDKIAALVDSAPATLNTLNELAAALGDDPNFATTVATNIGKIDAKFADYLSLSGGILTGVLTLDSSLGAYSFLRFTDRRIGSQGYVDNILQITDAEGRIHGALGLYGNSNGVTYYYLGCENDTYNGNNFRVYADKVTFGDNTIYHAGNFNPADYLPLSGGTLTGALSIDASATSDHTLFLRSNKKDSEGSCRIYFADSTDAFQGYVMTGWGDLILSHRSWKQIGVGDSGIWCSTDNGTTKNALIHSGNYSDYALPITGGTISGDPAYLTLRANRSGADAWLQFTDAQTSDLYAIGLRRPADRYGLQYRINNDYYTLIHSGNIGSQIVEGITTHTSDATNANGDIAKLNSYYSSKGFRISRFNGLNGLGIANADGLIVNWPLDHSYGQQWYMDDESHTIQTRYVSGGTWSGWKTIAFTDSTVDKAKSVVDASGNALTLIHSGNIGEYAFTPRAQITSNTDADTLITNGVYLNATGNGSGNSNFPSAYSILISAAQENIYAAQISIASNFMHVRRKINTWSDWKTVAFTDSNVASADSAKVISDYSNSRITSADVEVFGDSGVRKFIASSYMTSGKPPYDGSILHFSWDTAGGYEHQLFIASDKLATSEQRMAWRAQSAGVWGDWKTIAFTDSNVASATKLATARTLWGQSFDGTGNVDGDIKTSGEVFLNHNKAIRMKGSNGTDYNVLFTSGTDLNIGYDSPVIRFGGSKMYINGDGNVTIGSSDLAGTSYALCVNGDNKFYDKDNTLKLYTKIKGSGVQVGRTTSAYTGGYNGGVTIGEDDSNLGYIAGAYNESTGSSKILFHYGGTNQNDASICINGISGSVGIHKTNPAYLLEVNGTFGVASTSTFGGLTTHNSGISTPHITIGGITLSVVDGALKIDGNVFATGQLATREAGQPTSGGGSVVLDHDSIVDALGFAPASSSQLTTLTNRVASLERKQQWELDSNGVAFTMDAGMVVPLGTPHILGLDDSGQCDLTVGDDSYATRLYGSSILANGSDVLTKANTSFTRNYSSGTKIGTIKIGGTSTDIYAPASSSSSLWTTEYDITVGTEVLFGSKEYIGTNTIVGWDSAGLCVNDLYIGYDGYTIWMQGSVDEASDMRLKTVIDAVNLDIRDIAFAPIFNYVFKSRPQGRQMLGSSAQYWQPIAPCAVSENDKGNLAMNYGAIALASVVSVAKKTLTHEEEIAELKSKVQSLETRLAKYELN